MLRRRVSLALLALCMAASGCGSANSNLAPAAKVSDFPAATGKRLRALVAGLPQNGPIFAASVSVLRVGSNRVGFALFDVSRKQITTAEAALYVTDGAGRTVTGGPYPAHEESLSVAPAFQSQTVASDPNAAHSVYVAQVPIPRAGRWQLVALVRVGGRLEFAGGTALLAGESGTPPDVGQPAIPIHTPTVAQVGLANASTIDTRLPAAPELETVDFASVLGHKPVVLLFATPQLCVSRVCGPVTDIEDQVRSETGNRVAFIHMEIYNRNTVTAGFRPQVLAWRLPTEPWLFAINSQGRIVERFEGAYSVAELRAAVQRLQ